VSERAVRLVLDIQGRQGSRRQAVLSISSKIGCAPEILKERVDKAEIGSGKCAGVPGAMAERRMALERGLRQGAADDETIRGVVFPTHASLRKASADLAMAEFDR